MSTRKDAKSRRGFVICLAIVCLAAAGLLSLYLHFRPAATEGMKTVTLEVIYEDSTVETYTAHTAAQYLEQAMSDMEGLTVDGARSKQLGLMILTVNGVEADYDKDNAYWSIYLGEEACNYGVSQQPVEDGQRYRLVYTVGDAS